MSFIYTVNKQRQLHEIKIYFTYDQRLEFKIVLYFKRHIVCNFWLKTNEKIYVTM